MTRALLPDSGRSSRISAIERLVLGTLYLLFVFPIILVAGGVVLLLLALGTILWGLVFGKDVPKSYKVTRSAQRILGNLSNNLTWIVTGKQGLYPIPGVNVAVVARN